MKRIILGIMLIILTACETEKTIPITPEFDRSDKVITLKVYTYDNSRQLNFASDEFARQRGLKPDGNLKEGWSGWSRTPPYQCEIHTLKLKSLTDPQMETWGHELAHCIYGTYHKENER